MFRVIDQYGYYKVKKILITNLHNAHSWLVKGTRTKFLRMLCGMSLELRKKCDCGSPQDTNRISRASESSYYLTKVEVAFPFNGHWKKT